MTILHTAYCIQDNIAHSTYDNIVHSTLHTQQYCTQRIAHTYVYKINLNN